MHTSNPSPLLIEELPFDRFGEYRDLVLAARKSDPFAFSPEPSECQTTIDSVDAWKDRLVRQSRFPFQLFFLEAGGTLIGMGGIKFHHDERFQHNAHLQSLYVRQEYRRRGFGRLLVEKRLEFLKQQPGIRNVLCEIFSSQVPSLQIHFRCGFRRCGRVDKFLHVNGVFYDSLLLQKDLRN